MMAGCEIEIKFLPADGKFPHARGCGGAVFFNQFGKLFKFQHAAES